MISQELCDEIVGAAPILTLGRDISLSPFNDDKEVHQLTVAGYDGWSVIDGVPEHLLDTIVAGSRAMRMMSVNTKRRGRAKLKYNDMVRTLYSVGRLEFVPGINVIDQEQGIWLPLLYVYEDGEFITELSGPLPIMTMIRYSQEALITYIRKEIYAQISTALRVKH